MLFLLQQHGQRGTPNIHFAARRAAAEYEDVLHAFDRRDQLAHFLGGPVGIGERGSGWQFHTHRDARDVVRRQEGPGDLCHEVDGHAERRECDEKRGVTPPKGVIDEAGIGLHDRAVLLAFLVGIARAHQIGGHHRGDEACDQKREEHRKGDGQSELHEILAGNAWHEGNGHEHGDDGEGCRNDRQTDFVCRIHCRAIGRFAHLDMPRNVLDLDDRVIDENTCRQRDREEADEVERETEKIHHVEGGDGR